ncbi:hypothetical protein KB976_000317 [Vibrio parahaemolyticus]|nr:hypothetical protein [Vibrio parahaemolyticus]
MSEFKNHYGDNVAWFCADVSISLDENNEDGMLDSSVEVYGEDEQGREDSTEIEVIKLLESAHVVIEEKDARIKQLEEALRNALAITTDSTGVAGYHLNGEVVAWDEFEEIEVAQSLLEANVGKIEYRRVGIMNIKRVKVNKPNRGYYRYFVNNGKCVHGVLVTQNCKHCFNHEPF